MKPILNSFILQYDDGYKQNIRKTDGTIILGHDNKPLVNVSTEFDYAANQNRIATVKEIPLRLDPVWHSHSVLNYGDKVLLHREAFNPVHRLENGDWKIEPVHIIAKVLGDELQPLADRVFLERIENTETKVGSIYLPFAPQHIAQQGIVKWVSDNSYNWGIRSGDTAFMDKVAGAQVFFNGATYYTVDKEMLFGKKVGEELYPYGYYITVQPHPEKESLIFIPERRKENTLKGVVKGTGNIANEVEIDNEVLLFRLSYQSYGDLLIMREEFVIGVYQLD
jgi:co-chaperonin GroES (HSP10)